MSHIWLVSPDVGDHGVEAHFSDLLAIRSHICFCQPTPGLCSAPNTIIPEAIRLVLNLGHFPPEFANLYIDRDGRCRFTGNARFLFDN
jgi:hypothetical protein